MSKIVSFLNERAGVGRALRVVQALSFALGLAASVFLMLFPFLLHGVPGTRLHTGLPIMMLGVAGTLVYGIGYVPDNRALRFLFSPFCAWALIIAGAFLLFQK
jgi:predicted membrane protein